MATYLWRLLVSSTAIAGINAAIFRLMVKRRVEEIITARRRAFFDGYARRWPVLNMIDRGVWNLALASAEFLNRPDRLSCFSAHQWT